MAEHDFVCRSYHAKKTNTREDESFCPWPCLVLLIGFRRLVLHTVESRPNSTDKRVRVLEHSLQLIAFRVEERYEVVVMKSRRKNNATAVGFLEEIPIAHRVHVACFRRKQINVLVKEHTDEFKERQVDRLGTVE